MKILQINTLSNQGGAAKFCHRLKLFLDSNNIKNWLLVGKIIEKENNIIEIKTNIFEKLLSKLINNEEFSKNTFTKLKKQPFWNEIDLIHFHNLHGGFFNILALPKLSKNKKCIWTLHDPWIINNKKDLVPEYKNIFKDENLIFNKYKKRAIERSNITIVSPSVWLKNKVLKEYPNKKIEIINNGVDTNIFRPTNIIEARTTLNLPINKKIILFVANGGKRNLDKGTYYLNIIQNNHKDILFIELGGINNYINNEKDLALYYSAVDLLLFPSLAENFPLSILESMSCQTPVVAFNTGGIPEIIDHQINGYIAKYENAEDLSAGIDFIIKQKNDNMGKEARDKIIKYFDNSIIFKKYIDLYKEILN